MSQSWRKFLFLQFLGAAVTLALTFQALAFVLSKVSIWRDRADELALAVLSDPTNYRILLFGDSVTRNATARFALGTPREIANLSTHAFIGLSGSLFLLQRYLSVHPAPQYVIVALAPGVYHFDNNSRLSRYHLWHTFNRSNEREFLTAYHPGIGWRDSLPAILDLQERVVEPFLSYLKHRYSAFRKRGALSVASGILNPDPQAPVELAKYVFDKREDEVSVSDRDLTMARVNGEGLRRICELSKQEGFVINIVWPPIPDDLARAFHANGAFSQLETEIRSVMEGHCAFGGFTDFNKIRVYSSASFHHDSLHLFGDGWEQRYASDLRDYLSGLPDRVPSEAIR
jgi:hypothetical protein